MQIWHGAQDGIVPVERALALARALPRGHATILLGEGHFFLRRRLVQVLGALQDVAQPRYAEEVPAA